MQKAASTTRIGATVGVVCISFSAILVRAAEVSPSTAAFFRAVYAIPILAVVWWWRRDRDQRVSESRWIAVGAGLLLALDLTIWHHSIEMVGAGLATVLANAQVIFVALAAWLVWRERPSRATFWIGPVVIAGLVLVSGLGRDDAYGSNPTLGVILGAATGITYAAFLIVFRSATRRHDAPPAGPLLDATIGTAVGSLALGAMFGTVSFVPTWPAHGWLALLAIVSQVVGWLLIATALPKLPALETSVLLLIQPVAALLWGRLFFAETMSWIQAAGVVMVIIGVLSISARGATVQRGVLDVDSLRSRRTT
ncbi:MAG: EamA family transporter [Gammaproteobacteria bacterium]|nr:EamA family transporter [Gammaproteobacteria bacterium]